MIDPEARHERGEHDIAQARYDKMILAATTQIPTIDFIKHTIVFHDERKFGSLLLVGDDASFRDALQALRETNPKDFILRFFFYEISELLLTIWCSKSLIMLPSCTLLYIVVLDDEI